MWTTGQLIAAIGDIHRFPSAKKLVGYLGIDPRVRQSGQSPARQGRISKQGSSNCRHVLGEAAWSAVKTPGPLRAFYQRVRARRGAQVAIVATARKLACLCWQLLTTEQDYALETTNRGRPQTPRARTPRRRADEARHPARQGHTHDQAADPSRTPTHRTSRARLSTADPGLASHRQQPEWCGRRTGARITKAVKRHSSAAGNSPRTCALARGHPHHPKPSHAERNPSTQPLTYMRRSFNYVVAVIGSSPPRATGLLSRNSAPSVAPA